MRFAWLRYPLHVGVWVLLYILPSLISSEQEFGIGMLTGSLGNNIHFISFLLLIGFSYLNYYWLVPRVYLGKQYLLYAILLALCLFVVAKLPQFITPGLPDKPGGSLPFDKPGRPGPPGDGPPVLGGMTYNIILFFVSTLIAISIQQRLQFFRIEKEKLNAELSFLKAQINPHFLFNTLNSIYSLALVKSDETPTAITQLSELMRYIMRDSQAERVPLEKELGYIRNYIALQKSRLGSTVSILFEEAVKTSGQRIAPLLLMSFIENAFKHGVNPDEDSQIEIELSLNGDVLHLFVFNNKTGTTHKDDWTGIGLQNTKDRLQHLYPGKHKLTIDDGAKTFTVNLTLNVA